MIFFGVLGGHSTRLSVANNSSREHLIICFSKQWNYSTSLGTPDTAVFVRHSTSAWECKKPGATGLPFFEHGHKYRRAEHRAYVHYLPLGDMHMLHFSFCGVLAVVPWQVRMQLDSVGSWGWV